MPANVSHQLAALAGGLIGSCRSVQGFWRVLAGATAHPERVTGTPVMLGLPGFGATLAAAVSTAREDPSQRGSARRCARLLAQGFEMDASGLDAVDWGQVDRCTHHNWRRRWRSHVSGQIAQRAGCMAVRPMSTRFRKVRVGGRRHGGATHLVDTPLRRGQLPGHRGRNKGGAHGKHQHHQQEAGCVDQ